MTNQQNTKRVTITTDNDGKNVVIRNSQTGEAIPMVESCSIHIDASTVVPRALLTVWNPSIDITCDAEIHKNDIEKQEETIAFEAEKKCISDRLKDALAKIADLELQLSQCKAWLDRESGLHGFALDQLSKIEKLVTHDGCGNTYARVAAEIGLLKRKLNDPKPQ